MVRLDGEVTSPECDAINKRASRIDGLGFFFLIVACLYIAGALYLYSWLLLCLAIISSLLGVASVALANKLRRQWDSAHARAWAACRGTMEEALKRAGDRDRAYLEGLGKVQRIESFVRAEHARYRSGQSAFYPYIRADINLAYTDRAQRRRVHERLKADPGYFGDFLLEREGDRTRLQRYEQLLKADRGALRLVEATSSGAARPETLREAGLDPEDPAVAQYVAALGEEEAA